MGGGKIGQAQQFLAQRLLQHFLLLFQGGHLFLDCLASSLQAFRQVFQIIQLLPLLDLPEHSPHLATDPLALGLEIGPLLRQLLHLPGLLMEGVNIHPKTTAGQLRRHVVRILANKAWVKHSGGVWWRLQPTQGTG